MIDFLGHIFYAFLCVGLLLIAYGYRQGWLFRLVGEAGWVGLGLAMDMSSIYLWGMLFMGIDLIGLVNSELK